MNKNLSEFKLTVSMTAVTATMSLLISYHSYLVSVTILARFEFKILFNIDILFIFFARVGIIAVFRRFR
jgi:hypothetical protein